MAFIEIAGTFADIRLNIQGDGSRHVGGGAQATLEGGDASDPEEERWFTTLTCTWELVAIGEHWVPAELEDVVRGKPDNTHVLVQLHGKHLIISAATDLRAFNRCWDMFERHLGAANLAISIGVLIEGFLGMFTKPDKTFRATLESGTPIVTVASLGFVPETFKPFVPNGS